MWGSARPVVKLSTCSGDVGVALCMEEEELDGVDGKVLRIVWAVSPSTHRSREPVHKVGKDG